MSYVEYSTSDEAREALKILKTVSLTTGGNSIKIKAALLKVNKSRNWALKESKKLLTNFAKESEQFKNEAVEIDWPTRCVKVGTTTMFEQKKDEQASKVRSCTQRGP